MTADLSEFIEENRNTALIVIRKSGWYKKLDDNDIDEIIYSGLWECYQKYDPSKSSLPYFINLTLSSYILRLVKKKLRYKSREVQLDDYISKQYENPSENFTDSEWESIEPIFHGNSISEAGKIRGLDKNYYSILLKSIKHFRKESFYD